jgi:hypothetical protein
MKLSSKTNFCIIFGFSFLSALIWWLIKGKDINGDEAVVGLMSLKIIQGVDFPFFFWKAHYGGPVASYLTAPLHFFWAPSGMLLHSIMLPIHIFYACGIYLLARKWLPEHAALMAGLFASLPARLFPYSPLGGFTESIALIPWILLIHFKNDSLPNNHYNSNLQVFMGGFLCGFALWIMPTSFPIVLTYLILLYKESRKNEDFRMGITGLSFGLLPVIFYNVIYPGATFLRLFSRPVGLDKQSFIDLANTEGIIKLGLEVTIRWLSASYESILNLPKFTTSLVGMQSQGTGWNYLAGSISLVAFISGLWFYLKYRNENKNLAMALFTLVLTNYAFFVFFGMNHDRYLICALITVPFGLAIGIHNCFGSFNKWISSTLLIMILLLNGASNFVGWGKSYLYSADFVSFLETQGLTRGYARYSVAYPLSYLSNERLIYTPAFHTPSSDRYPEYTRMVSQSDNPAFIFIDDSDADLFRHRLTALKVGFKEERWRNYTIFHNSTPRQDLKHLTNDFKR